MKDELLEKLEAMEKEINEIKKKHSLMHDYKLVVTAFDKLGVEYIELNVEEVENNNSLYIVEHNSENRKFIIRKEVNDERNNSI